MFRLLGSIGLAFSILGCFFLTTPDVPAVMGEPHPGMIRIRSEHVAFYQGSNGALAGYNEKPAFKNGFTYAFQLDTTEVTQAAFRDLMFRDPVPDGSPFGKGDGLPVYNVTWFDAVLYCNARGKAEGMDTVYTFSAISKDNEGAVYGLADLAVHLEIPGYRLPTEAEWEYSANGGMKTEFPWGTAADSAEARNYAWYSENAGGRAHPVAGLKANAFGLYDMAGNVMEWVNDWMGAYPSQASTDFAGSRDPAVNSDTPVKGGAYKSGFREMRPANRSATYATIRSSMAPYVGFRCAFGAIPSPQFTGEGGRISTTDPVILDFPRIQNLVGERPAKLVFVNATQSVRHLVYVDYAEEPPRIREFDDVENVFHPVISPDGNWVAYGTAVEGTDLGSVIHVRPLTDSISKDSALSPGFIPRWWVEPVLGDTSLLYSSSAADNSQSKFPAAATWIRKMRGGRPVGAAALLADGAFHDGRSLDGRWLATGFTRLKLRDDRNGNIRTLFTAPDNGKAEGDTSQVCNVSMAPDSSGRTLFLDFGYAGQSGLTGTAYDVHAYAFIADAEGKVSRWFKAPAGEVRWEDLEWTNHAEFAVSSGADPSNNRRHLYLLNLKYSLSTRLATGTFLSMPGLWLGAPTTEIPTNGLDLDSLGRYNDPPTSDARAGFANKMHLFWEHYGEMQAAFIGSSQMADGLDPAELTGLKSYNLGFGACGLLGVDYMARNYLLPNCRNLKLIGLSTLIGWFSSPEGDPTWKQYVAGSKGIDYDERNGFWKSGLPFGFPELAMRAPKPVTGSTANGLIQFPSASWGASPPAMESWAAWNTSEPDYQPSFALLEKLISEITSRKIHCLFILFPQSPEYGKTPVYGSHGPDWKTAETIIARLRGIESVDPFFHLMDYNMDGKHDYTDSEAFDSMHLSWIGARKLSAGLNEDIRKILAP